MEAGATDQHLLVLHRTRLQTKGSCSLRPGRSKVVEWPPPQQRTAASEKAFKTQLKTHLFRQASDHFQSSSVPLFPHVRLCPVPGPDCYMPQCWLCVCVRCVCVMCQVLQVFLDGDTRLVPIINREKGHRGACVCGRRERKRERESCGQRERERVVSSPCLLCLSSLVCTSTGFLFDLVFSKPYRSVLCYFSCWIVWFRPSFRVERFGFRG